MAMSKKNPVATILMENGAKIVIELLPEAAPNTVNSFLYAAKRRVFDHHAIERIVPDSWIDMSYTGFRKKEGQYLIPYESRLHPEITPPDTIFGCVAMGGYGELGQAGCEFFFPLGTEEILRLKDVRTRPVEDFPYDVAVNTPVEPQVIREVTVETFGEAYPDPVFVDMDASGLPLTWKRFREGKL